MNIVSIEGENYYRIADHDKMRPFFMSIVSDANHWMFISSNGGLTAGRKNAEFALFPYYTDDKITESYDITGSKSIFQIHHENQIHIWEPFSERFSHNMFTISRNLYKNLYGNKVIFEEVNHDLKLTYSYQWNSSNKYGFVRKSELINNSENDYQITILDGIQNIIPFGVTSDLQNAASNLVDAYKRSELHKQSGLGIFALSAIIVDKAEPSEALKSNVVWSLGMKNPSYLVASLQLSNFRNKQKITSEDDIKGEKGAYFLNTEINLTQNSKQEWMIVANVNQDHSDIAQIICTSRQTATLLLNELQEKNLIYYNRKEIMIDDISLKKIAESTSATPIKPVMNRCVKLFTVDFVR